MASDMTGAGPSIVMFSMLGANSCSQLSMASYVTTCPVCAALLDWSTDRFRCPACGFAEPETPNVLDGEDLVLGDTRVVLGQLPS